MKKVHELFHNCLLSTSYDFEPKSATDRGKAVLYILVSIVMTFITSIFTRIVLYLMNSSPIVSVSNRGDYLAIFATHCSVVFLTTSLMAMLSENNHYVYWVEMVTSVLIYPRFISFLPLVIYSISTIVWAMVGFVVFQGWIIIGSFLFGLISVTVLFSRMVSIYYQQNENKRKIEEFLLRLIDNDGDYQKYLKKLKEVTFIKADERAFCDVYDNLKVIENCIKRIPKKEERESDKIFYPKGSAEQLFFDLLVDLSIKYPQEMQNYIEVRADKEDSIIQDLCYLAYPSILDSFIYNNRRDLFYRLLNKWSNIDKQRASARNYIVDKALSGNDAVIADYYNKLFNPFVREIPLASNMDLDTLYALCNIYDVDKRVFEDICEYHGNRGRMCQHFCKKKEQEIFAYCVLSETVLSKNNGVFEAYISHLFNKELYNRKIGKKEESVMCSLFNKIIKTRDVEDIEYLGEKILVLIMDLDSEVYLSVGSDIQSSNNYEIQAFNNVLIENIKKSEKQKNDFYKKDVLQKLLNDLDLKTGVNVSK